MGVANPLPPSSILRPQSWLQEVLHAPHAASRKHVIEAILESYEPAWKRRAARMNDCCRNASLLVFPTAHQVHPWMASCGDRLCTWCARGRAVKVARKISAAIAEFDHPRLVVLTVRSSDVPLRRQLDGMDRDFRNLRRRPFCRSHVKRGICTKEITLNPTTRRSHPHLHMIYEGSFYPKVVLSKMWLDVTGDSFIVDISEVWDNDGASWELAKYLGKPAHVGEWSHEEIRTYAAAIKSRRMVQKFGLRAGAIAIEKPEPLPDDRRAIGVGLGRLISLCRQDVPLALELADVAARCFPSFGHAIYKARPDLIPPELGGSKTSVFLARARGQVRALQLRAPDPDRAELLVGRIITLAGALHEAGLADQVDFGGAAAAAS